MSKRLISFLLAAVMLMALSACTGEGKPLGEASADPLTKDDVVKLTVFSHASWPYKEDWKIWDYIEEGTGATLEVTAIPGSDVKTKIPLIFAAQDTMPDIMYFDYKPTNDQYSAQGALIAFDDVAEYMPNYKKFVDSLSEERYASIVTTRKGGDGKVYMAPITGTETTKNVQAWLYRKDIFDANNLSVPTTFDELYEVCKKLKEIYPDSYPLCLRNAFVPLDTTGSSWQPYWVNDVYYDYDAEKWCFGPIEDVTVEIVEFYNKMINEKLVNVDFLTTTTQAWQELVTTNRGFIMPEYQTRIDFFNGLAREKIPEFDLVAMAPPVAREGGAAMIRRNIDATGMSICNTGREEGIANAAKFLDWFYTDEAELLVGWGKEGETYEVVDGKKKFISDETGAQANTLYGIGTAGTYLRIDSESVESAESEDIAKTRDMVFEHTAPYTNPLNYLALNPEEQKIKDEKYVEITAYADEMLSKFILGQEPISKFDEFVQSVKDMDVDKLLGAYASAFNRIK